MNEVEASESRGFLSSLRGGIYPCKVLFSDEFTVKFNVLGRAGIFDRFRVCFDDAEKKLYLYDKA